MTEQTLPFKFSGSGNEYFKIWIVNLILTILTLGIYSAWAKVRTKRYFFGNTNFNNAAFEYHATPMVILKGRLIAFAAFVIYVLLSNLFPIAGAIFVVILMLLMPWVVWRSIQFNARMISYRNIRFSFCGMLKEAYKILVLVPLLPIIIGAILGSIAFMLDAKGLAAGIAGITVLAFYLIFPYVQKLMTGYYVNNRQYGQGKFAVQLSAKKYYMMYLALLSWTIVWTSLIALVMGAIVGIIMWLTGNLGDITAIMQQDDPSAIGGMIVLFMFLLYIPFILLGLWGTAYLQTNIKNYVLSNVKLDDVLQLNSRLKVGKLFGIYVTNTLLIIVTFGLAYPWAAIRMKKYKVESTSAIIKGDIAQYMNRQQEAQSALGEELGEAFDTTIDLGM